MEATPVPINRCMDKEDVVHTGSGILLRHKKEWNIAICHNMMDLEGIMLSEICQKTNILCYHLYVESKKIKKYM